MAVPVIKMTVIRMSVCTGTGNSDRNKNAFFDTEYLKGY